MTRSSPMAVLRSACLAAASKIWHCGLPAAMSSEPSEEDIRLRAYHRYLERGGGHGADFEDWLRAEQELVRHYA